MSLLRTALSSAAVCALVGTLTGCVVRPAYVPPPRRVYVAPRGVYVAPGRRYYRHHGYRRGYVPPPAPTRYYR